jgi:hypothetical protein
MAKKEKDIAASEVVGELRRIHRVFRVLERANDAADVLEGYESKVKKLKSEIAALGKEKTELDKQCDDAWAKKAEAEASIKKLAVREEEAIADLEKKIDVYKERAKGDAEAIMKTASAKKEAIGKDVMAANASLLKVKEEEKLVLNSIKALKEEIKRTKEAFIQSL